MDITAIKNSPGMWIAAGIMILIIVIQAALFMRMAKKEANALGISKEKQKEAKRSAVVAAVGPTLALSIMLVTLMASLGGAHRLDADERCGIRTYGARDRLYRRGYGHGRGGDRGV